MSGNYEREKGHRPRRTRFYFPSVGGTTDETSAIALPAPFVVVHFDESQLGVVVSDGVRRSLRTKLAYSSSSFIRHYWANDGFSCKPIGSKNLEISDFLVNTCTDR